MVRFMSGPQAAELITDGATIAMLGNGGATVEPRYVYRCIGQRYSQTGAPQQLNLIHSAGIGNRGEEGLARFAQPGMTKRVIGGHWAWSPAMQALAVNGEIEAYNLPQGVICQQYREIAAKRPGLITKTGLGTFVDPRIGGGRLNDASPEDIVELIQFRGEEWLYFPPWTLDFGIIRATTADENGNLSFEDEVAFLEATAVAQAVHNCGGTVIAQVNKVLPAGELNPQLVKVPGILVDVVVVDEDQQQTCQGFDPALCGQARVELAELDPMPLDQRKIIARRAALELRPGMIYNLGFGIPDGVSTVLAEEGVADQLTATIEQGLVGGIPARGDIFGAAYNAEAFVDAPSQFDFYAGGGLDLTCLGMAQVDQAGNVNVSKFGSTIAGCGGFIDISQNAKECIFCGTFTAGGLRTKVEDGQLRIVQEGKFAKFLPQVEQITFSGKYAYQRKQPVRYITERAVFELSATGLVLTEIAPGIDLESQILALLDFELTVSPQLKTMDSNLFQPGLIGLASLFNELTAN